jgi:hypothetical protein
LHLKLELDDIGVVAAATPGLEATKGMTPLQLQDFISQDPERGKLLLESLQHVEDWELIVVKIFLLKNKIHF